MENTEPKTIETIKDFMEIGRILNDKNISNLPVSKEIYDVYHEAIRIGYENYLLNCKNI